MNEKHLRDVFSSVEAPESVGRMRPAWLAPMAALGAVVVVAAGLGAYFGIRAVQGSGPGPAGASSLAPSPRYGAAMAYDEANGTVVLFGGLSLNGTQLADTWTWSGGGWVRQHPRHSPPADAHGLAAYDPVTHDVLLEPTNPFPSPQPAWLWDGGDWHAAPGAEDLYQHTAAAAALGIAGPAQMATDPVSHRIVLVANSLVAPGCGPIAAPGEAIACPMLPAQPDLAFGGTWEWTGSSWQRVGNAPPSPGLLTVARDHGSVPARSPALFFFTFDYGSISDGGPCFAAPNATPQPCPQPAFPIRGTQASYWTGSSWLGFIGEGGGAAAQLSLPAAAAYDVATDSLVAWSAQRTWAWAYHWAAVTPKQSPPADMMSPEMTYDVATRQVLLEGVVTSGGTAHGETWSWDGSNWTLLAQSTAAAPPEPSILPAPAPTGPIVEPTMGWSSACPATQAHPGQDLHPICPVPPA